MGTGPLPKSIKNNLFKGIVSKKPPPPLVGSPVSSVGPSLNSSVEVGEQSPWVAERIKCESSPIKQEVVKQETTQRETFSPTHKALLDDLKPRPVVTQLIMGQSEPRTVANPSPFPYARSRPSHFPLFML